MFTHSSPTPVRFGHCSGFAFDGDFVRLDADLVVTSPLEAGAHAWSLQLRAVPANAGGDVGEITLAELPCGMLSPDEHGRISISGTAIASLPAGGGDYALSLALADGEGCAGVYDRVRFERNEAFPMPRLGGTVGYAFEGDVVRLSVERIENPRGSDNLSGTLTLELWALTTPYQGGPFSGVQFGSVTLGTLAGQASWSEVAVDLPRAELAPGQWQLVMMLREWTPAGYLTRDFCNFAMPLNIAEVSPAAERPTAADNAPAASVITAQIAEPAKAQGPAVSATLVQPAPSIKAGHPAVSTQASKPAASAKAAPPAASPTTTPSKAQAAAKAPSEAGVSLNSASEAELLALPGLTAKLVKAIIAGRPWAQTSDLIMVKGIGPKMLERLRPLVRR